MSRHVVLDTPRRQVVVGWDPPTRRFFGQVFDKDAASGEMTLAFEFGDVVDRRGEPWELERVIAALAPYARVPAFVRRALERDAAAGQAELEQAWRQLAALVAEDENAAR